MSPHEAELYEQPPILTGRCDMIPPKTSHHSKRIVRMGKFSHLADSPQLKSARETWFAALRPFQPAAPLEGPLRLELAFTWPWRKSDRRGVSDRIPYPSRPDCDNLAKTCADCMAALCFFRDDAQVVDLHVTKWLGERPGMAFSLWKVQA